MVVAANSVLEFVPAKKFNLKNYLPTRDVMNLALFLSILQALDGLLTALGVSRFGTSIEGNPLLRTLMEEFGYVPTLASMKIAAVGIIGILAILAKEVPWIPTALKGVCGIYLVMAIIPWTYILFIGPYLG